MRDNKAFASLTSGLLARKGQARPAMRPQGFSQATSQADDLGWNDMGVDAPRVAGIRLPVQLAGPRAAADTLPEVLRQQDEIVREFAEPEAAEPAVADAPATEPIVIDLVEPVDEPMVAVAAPAQSDPIAEMPPVRAARVRRAATLRQPVVVPRDAGRKAAFTLRLDTERHLLLRLACAVQNRSAQQIVTGALDLLLADMPEVARLAASLPIKD